jgi:hypothetical protein
MGRWPWIKERGKNNITLIVCTVYRPVKSEGALSTYQQQKSILLEEGKDKCPRAELLTDLETQIKE